MIHICIILKALSNTVKINAELRDIWIVLKGEKLEKEAEWQNTFHLSLQSCFTQSYNIVHEILLMSIIFALQLTKELLL